MMVAHCQGLIAILAVVPEAASFGIVQRYGVVDGLIIVNLKLLYLV